MTKEDNANIMINAIAANVKLAIDPATYILIRDARLNEFNSSSSGSTKAPGRIANKRRPMEFILIFSTLAKIP